MSTFKDPRMAQVFFTDPTTSTSQEGNPLQQDVTGRKRKGSADQIPTAKRQALDPEVHTVTATVPPSSLHKISRKRKRQDDEILPETAAKRVPPVPELAPAVETDPAQQRKANRLAKRFKELFGEDDDDIGPFLSVSPRKEIAAPKIKKVRKSRRKSRGCARTDLACTWEKRIPVAAPLAPVPAPAYEPTVRKRTAPIKVQTGQAGKTLTSTQDRPVAPKSAPSWTQEQLIKMGNIVARIKAGGSLTDTRKRAVLL